jgi:hypothetical protein
MRLIRPTFLVLAFWCVAVSQAWAVNIYDVIELSRSGFADEDIVNIIETTRSVFTLEAEDIPRLKELGVSEGVIRAMLASDPGDLSGADLAGTPLHAEPDDYGRGITPHQFSLRAVPEEAAGDHQHIYVTLLGAPILILRDEGRFQSVEERGMAVVRNLEEAIRLGDGGFRFLHTNGVDQVVFHSADLQQVPIITLDPGDIYAYDVRSESRVTSDVLAAYWAALLNDFWAISVQHRPPSRLVNLHRGAALKLLYEVVNTTNADDRENLESAIAGLPVEIQGHLERLATAVPDDFSVFAGSKGEM